jgi:HPt (histidine-containing phosphotransfer) domain-containing protein
VHRQAHSLKGAIRFFGAPTAAEAASRMEQAGRDGDFDAALTLFGPLEHELEKLRSALAAGSPGGDSSG